MQATRVQHGQVISRMLLKVCAVSLSVWEILYLGRHARAPCSFMYSIFSP